MAPKTSKNTTLQTTDLEELIDVLAVLGVSVRSPHQRMAEEAAVPAESEAEAEVAEAEALLKAEATAAQADAEAIAIATAEAAAEAEAAQAKADAIAAATAEALSSPAGPLTRELVVKALRALGFDVSEAAPPPAEAGPSTAPGTLTSKGKGVAQPPTPASPGLRCTNCNHWNPLPGTAVSINPPNVFYVVTVGRDVGIYTDWHLTSSLVTGVSGAIFKKYPTRKEAEDKFNEALSQGRVRRV